MNLQTIELNLAQLQRSLTKSSLNKYSDLRKEKFAKGLDELYSQIREEDKTWYSLDQLKEIKKYIDFIYSNITFLDNSTLTVIPYELVSCLEQALKEWIPGGDYIVVTSLENNLLGYSVNGSYALDDTLFFEIETKYSIKFENRLIQIRLPKHYARDYLANVVLYHELGHFVDQRYNISVLTFSLFNGGKPVTAEDRRRRIYHYMEYFADLFAAQYIGNTSNIFLDYIAHKHLVSFTHPSTDDRIKVVEDFLGSKRALSQINELESIMASRSPIKKFSIRYVDLDPSDFYQLIPIDLKENDLHSVFVLGWKIWMDTGNPLFSSFDSITTYKIINNLVEKSISNYFVTKLWNG